MAVDDRLDVRTDALQIALAGNPNTGKSTLFNALTGGRQHVGNYPGVTVEKKQGVRAHAGRSLSIVDLPGAYSLTAYAADELVARNHLVQRRPDVVVDIVDTSNLERNLYLTLQLIEMGLSVVLALNMSDVASARGIKADPARLSARLGVPVVEIVASKDEGLEELLDSVVLRAQSPASGGRPGIKSLYGDTIERAIERVGDEFIRSEAIGSCDARWMAIKALEGDRNVLDQLRSDAATAAVRAGAAAVERALGQDPEIAIAQKRYERIARICSEAVRSAPEMPADATDRIDAIVTHRLLGIPIFAAIMYLVFQFTFSAGGPAMDWLDGAVHALKGFVAGLWPQGSVSLLKSLLTDGVIAGAGSVVAFVPNIVLLFFAIAVLEDSGYMARAAFVMDRLMHRIGLHGKSFIPFIIGFGCSVPAIMAARSLEDRRERLLTILVAPLISCGARLPIYLLIIPAFFARRLQTPMLALMYLIGIILAIACAKLLSATILKGDSSPLVMELPPYRLPVLKNLLAHTWDRASLYLTKIGTVILSLSVVLWLLTTFPVKRVFSVNFDALTVQAHQTLSGDALRARLVDLAGRRKSEAMAYTIAGRVGDALTPALKPIGFDGRIGTALIGAFAAKEVFVAQLGISFAIDGAGAGSASLRGELQKHYSMLTGFCIMLYCLISAPCIATFAVTKRESGALKWSLLQFGGMTAIAYAITLIVYQIGMRL